MVVAFSEGGEMVRAGFLARGATCVHVVMIVSQLLSHLF